MYEETHLVRSVYNCNTGQYCCHCLCSSHHTLVPQIHMHLMFWLAQCMDPGCNFLLAVASLTQMQYSCVVFCMSFSANIFFYNWLFPISVHTLPLWIVNLHWHLHHKQGLKMQIKNGAKLMQIHAWIYIPASLIPGNCPWIIMFV